MQCVKDVFTKAGEEDEGLVQLDLSVCGNSCMVLESYFSFLPYNLQFPLMCVLRHVHDQTKLFN